MSLQNTKTSCSSFFSLPPPNLKKTTASKVQYLYEINYIPGDLNTKDKKLPLINPYKAFTNPFTSFFKSAKTFLNPCRQNPKKCIKVTDEHPIPSGEQERIITLQIPPERISQWIAQGCTYIHFGAIRLGLTFHGRKGLPIAARIALLDSRFLEYQPACLVIVETTLNAGTVFVTLFPNYNMSLLDRCLSTVFWVHIQIVGAGLMEQGLIQATLHSEMVYSVQDVFLHWPIPSSKGILLIQVDSQNVTSTTHIPRNISREEFVSILPETWVTIYENRRAERK